MNDPSDQPEKQPDTPPVDAQVHRDLAERTADLAASEAANEALRRVNAELARSRAALAAREAQLRLALDAARMAHWEWQEEGDRVTGSPGREALYGKPPGSLGDTEAVLAAVHPEDRERAAATIGRALLRPPGESTHDATEFRVTDPDGTLRWLRSQGGVTDWDPVTGKAVRAAGVTWDITERKRAEAWLSRGAAILEATPDLVAMADAASGRLTFINAAFRRVLALPPDADIASIALIEDCHPPEVVRMLREMALPTAAREGSWTGEGAVLPRDGRGPIPVSQVVLAHRGPDGRVESIAAIMRDLSEHKSAEEERLLLAREVDHRAKNTLAVVQAALRLTPREDIDAYVRAVEGRVMALARAHTLLADARWSGASLKALARAELAAFLPGADADPAPPSVRARVEGPELLLTPPAAQAVSMALHELATNATKHGALSVPDGRIAISWGLDHGAGLLRLRWQESGGPPVSAPPAHRGFGSRVVQATVEEQLGGSVERRWENSGLVCDVTLPLPRILPPPPVRPGDRHPAATPHCPLAPLGGPH